MTNIDEGKPRSDNRRTREKREKVGVSFPSKGEDGSEAANDVMTRTTISQHSPVSLSSSHGGNTRNLGGRKGDTGNEAARGDGSAAISDDVISSDDSTAMVDDPPQGHCTETCTSRKRDYVEEVKALT